MIKQIDMMLLVFLNWVLTDALINSCNARIIWKLIDY